MQRKFITFLIVGFYTLSAQAIQRDVTIQDKSTSGRTVRINAGQKDGLGLREALLIREENQKLVAARIIAVQPDSSVAFIVEKYSETQIPKGGQYNILYGVPLGDIPDLPDNISDTLPPNPQDEKFFTPQGEEIASTPDLDDDNYEPEVKIRPNFPDKKINTPHHLTMGVGLYRNANLAETTLTNGNRSAKSMYQGYAMRYQYNFKSSFWMGSRVPVWIGAELGWGVYNFNQSYPNNSHAAIRVIPLNANVKYIWEINKFLHLYPYVGVQNNIVQASAPATAPVNDLRGTSIIAGGGARMLMSENIDARVDVGIDGALIAAVVKF